MAKPKKRGSSKVKARKPKHPGGHEHDGFCWNCGQVAVGATFALSLTQTAAFCCRCGTRLAENGTCRMPACPFFELRPKC